ncbi:MAG TPA: FtsX-like permease family protein, partial [Flavisolibacter sp.]|nr:FtsX-like permease family protein [Flavisolibacter sp.]
QIRSVKGIKNISMVVEEKALLQNKAGEEDSSDYQSVVSIKGVDSNYASVSGVAQQIVEGKFNTGTEDQPLLVLGAGIESALSVLSDRNIKPLVIYMPRKGDVNLMDPFKSLSSDAVNTAGTFQIQPDFDNKYAITNLAFVKRMMGMPEDHYGAAEIATTPKADVNEVQDRLKKILQGNYIVQNRFEQNASLYSVMRIEKWIIYAILSLILVVAAFNMIGALTMLVLEKKQDITVLHALGAQQSFIQKIFLNEGLLLAMIGGGTGMLIAFLLGFLQNMFHFIPLQGNTFMIDYFPVKMVPSDFLLVGFTVLVIALVASWIPARKAALQQIELRSE